MLEENQIVFCNLFKMLPNFSLRIMPYTDYHHAGVYRVDPRAAIKP